MYKEVYQLKGVLLNGLNLTKYIGRILVCVDFGSVSIS